MDEVSVPTSTPNFHETALSTSQPKVPGSRWSTVSLIALIIVLFVAGIISEVVNMHLMGLVIYFIVWAIFVLIARLFPKSARPDTDLLNLERAGQKYKKIYYLLGCLMVISFPVFAFLFTLAFKTLQTLSLQLDTQQYVYVLPVTVWAFILPAVFLALISGYFLFAFLLKLYGSVAHVDQKEWAWAMYYLNNRTPYGDIDGNKVMFLLAILVVPICLIGLSLASGTYTKISGSQIIDNGYFSLKEKTYDFTQIDKILLVSQYKNKQTQELEKTGPYYSVVMKDGFAWSSLSTGAGSLQEEKEIVDFISQKSGKSITPGVHNVDD